MPDADIIPFPAARAAKSTDPNDPVFTKALKDYLPECWEIGVDRGAAYGDTWAIQNRVNTFKTIVLQQTQHPALTQEWLRLLDAAALLDTKASRFLGGFRRDHVVDGINYFAAFGYLLEDYTTRLEALQQKGG